jgi:hypothetical protein
VVVREEEGEPREAAGAASLGEISMVAGGVRTAGLGGVVEISVVVFLRERTKICELGRRGRYPRRIRDW